ncbi:MAG: YciI family protein [Alphaproteobacteria bacterium]|nr:YciI family protein [Alphaproteobacteria bacterium]
MRFMMLMIPKGYEGAPPDQQPPADRVAEMMKFNQAMQDAGILLYCEGLHPPSSGKRVSFAGGKPTVTDGPFTETKECLGGFWMIRVKSLQEAVDWARRCPGSDNEVIEIRRVQEVEDFNEEIKKNIGGFETMQGTARKKPAAKGPKAKAKKPKRKS